MPRRRSLSPAALALLAAAPLSAQQAPAANGWDPQQILRTEAFVKPPANIERMIMAPRVDISFTSPSPDARWFLRTAGADRGDIKAYGAPHIWLGAARHPRGVHGQLSHGELRVRARCGHRPQHTPE